MSPITRLVSVGNVVVDVLARIDALPARGADVLATAGRLEPGGGFNLMVAARRQGLATAYAGTVGTGPLGDLARAGLVRERIAVLLDPVPDADTGFSVAMTDADGERTFVTVVGAEAALTPARLDTVVLTATDALAVSGYGLLHPTNRGALVARLPRLPDAVTVVYDPGPLGHTAPGAARDAVQARTDWWTGNAREARLATGLADPTEAARALVSTLARGRVIVRTGADGCLLADRDGTVQHVPGYRADVVDTNGAGDTHTGAFVAALAAALDPLAAADRANAAAALAVGRSGPATAPTARQVDELVRTRRH